MRDCLKTSVQGLSQPVAKKPRAYIIRGHRITWKRKVCLTQKHVKAQLSFRTFQNIFSLIQNKDSSEIQQGKKACQMRAIKLWSPMLHFRIVKPAHSQSELKLSDSRI